jgi:hypothetical protein
MAKPSWPFDSARLLERLFSFELPLRENPAARLFLAVLSVREAVEEVINLNPFPSLNSAVFDEREFELDSQI